MTTAMSRRRRMSAASPTADGIELWQQRSALQPPPRASARYSGHSWLQLDLESWLPLELEDPRTVRRVSNDGNLLPTDQEISEDATDKPRKKSYGFLLAFTALATVAFVSSLDATTLSVALPKISEDLHATSLQSFWASISFLLTSVLFQPVHTIFSDIFGRKQVLYICILFFGAGSITIGAAQDITTVIAGRTIQGVGGGGLDCLSDIILTDMTTLKERPKYLGILSFVLAAGTVLGPVVGGGFSEYVSWRWTAWINLPFLAIALVLIPLFMKLKPIEGKFKDKWDRIDWGGILLFFLGTTLFVIGITWGGTIYKWTSWQTLGPIGVGVAALTAFGFYESRPTDPIIPYRILATRTRATVLFQAFLHGLILFSVVFYLPLYFESSIEHGPLTAAVDVFPMCFTIMPFAICVSFAIEYVRKYRWSVWFAWTLTIVGFGTLSLLRRTSNVAQRSGFQVLGGAGLGALYPALTIPMQASVPEEDVGVAMGLFVFARQLGGVIGVALGSTIFSNGFASNMKKLLPLPPSLDFLQNSNDAVSFVPHLKDALIDPAFKPRILDSYAGAIRWIWITMVALAGVGVLTSIFVKELTLEKTATARQGYVEE